MDESNIMSQDLQDWVDTYINNRATDIRDSTKSAYLDQVRNRYIKDGNTKQFLLGSSRADSVASAKANEFLVSRGYYYPDQDRRNNEAMENIEKMENFIRDYYPIQLQGVTVTPKGNRTSTYDDNLFARKKDQELKQTHRLQENIRQATNKAANAIEIGAAAVSAPAWAPALVSGIGAAYGNTIGRLLPWLAANHPTTYAALQTADGALTTKWAADGINIAKEGVQDMLQNGVSASNLGNLGIGVLNTWMVKPVRALSTAEQGLKSLGLLGTAKMLDKGITLSRPVTSRGVTLFNPGIRSNTDKSRTFLKGFNSAQLGAGINRGEPTTLLWGAYDTYNGL